MFDASRRFHALPAIAKQAIAINEFHRGYIAPKSSVIRSSSVARVTRPNASESFMAMHEVDPGDEAFGRPLQGPNQWPADLPGFREAVTAYREAMGAFARRFNRLLALALDLPEKFFDPHFERPTVWLRLMFYPPEPPGTPDDQYGAAPHTDYGFITFLAQDGLGGLEVRARDGGVDTRAADPGHVRRQRRGHARAVEQRPLGLDPAPGPQHLRPRTATRSRSSGTPTWRARSPAFRPAPRPTNHPGTSPYATATTSSNVSTATTPTANPPPDPGPPPENGVRVRFRETGASGETSRSSGEISP